MKMNLAKKTFIHSYKKLYNFVYQLCTSIFGIDVHKVIIVLSRENKLQGNLQFVFSELKEKYPSKKIHIVHTENKMNLRLFREIFSICNAKYIILDDYYLPIYLIHPNKQTKIIQLWHAAGAFKKFGYSTLGTKFGPSEEYLKIIPIHSNYTHVYVSSKRVIPYYAEAFNMSKDRIFALGTPRIDQFFNPQYKKKIIRNLYKTYDFIKNDEKINILIAPTYRAKGEHEESSLNIAEIITNPNFKLKDEIQIIYRPHPYSYNDEIDLFHNQSNIHIVNDFTINDWMLIADAFITDYSSAIFDYSLLYRPFAHFVPDIDEYRKNRGFYEDIETISDGAILSDIESLNEWINSRVKNEYFDTTRMIEYTFDNLGNSTEKIVRHFLDEEKVENV